VNNERERDDLARSTIQRKRVSNTQVDVWKQAAARSHTQTKHRQRRPRKKERKQESKQANRKEEIKKAIESSREFERRKEERESLQLLREHGEAVWCSGTRK
jgi:hypothetical protein